MTPLFHAVANETTKPVKDRRLVDPAGIARRLGEFHQFDVSAVIEVARELGNQFVASAVPGRLAFLPAPCVALDFGAPKKSVRVGMLIEQVGGIARCRVAAHSEHGCSIGGDYFDLPLGDEVNGRIELPEAMDGRLEQQFPQLATLIYGLLAIINTPRTFARKQHMPHAGLQRKLAAARGMVGKYPLRGWSEVLLRVSEPVIEGGRERGVILSGGKCLHYVRKHLRIIGGVVVHIGGRRVVLGGREIEVEGHFRGDPALGIKQTRYRLAP